LELNKFADMEPGEFRLIDIVGVAENVGVTVEAGGIFPQELVINRCVDRVHNIYLKSRFSPDD
jgi:hypothetical protein